MRIDFDIESKDLLLQLKDGQRRLAYAVVNAVNRTAKKIQAEEIEHVFGVFTVRKETFIKRQAAVIKPFASVKQQRAFAEIAVGQKKGLLLPLFEKGAKREPRSSSAKYVAMPHIGGPARPSFRTLTPPELAMKRLRFDLTKSGKRRAGALKTGTFLIPDVGIFQREGKAIRPVYHFRRNMRLDERLDFEEIAREVAAQWFGENLEREVVKAIQRSKGQGIE